LSVGLTSLEMLTFSFLSGVVHTII
jgi:hypothetical protein